MVTAQNGLETWTFWRGRMPNTMNSLLGQRGMTRVVGFCLFGLAINAVLIQTVTTDDSALKNGVRVGVIVLAALAVAVSGARMPGSLVLLIMYSTLMMAWTQNPDQLSYIFVFVLAFAMFAVKERSLEKALLCSSLASLGLVFVFLAVGITQDTVLALRDRHTFGTNGVPFFYNLVYGAFTMLLLYCFKYRLKYRFWVLAGSLAIATYLFHMTDARGGYIAFLVFVFLLFTVPVLSRLVVFRVAVVALPLIFLGFAFFLASLWNNDEANALFSIRPMLFERFLAELTEGDLFLSTSVKQFDRAVTIVDNSYLHLLVGGGVVMFVAVALVFGKAANTLFKADRHVEIAFLVATCVYFNSESIMLRIENMFVIYFWYLTLRYAITPMNEKAPGRTPDWARPNNPSGSRPGLTASR